MAHNHRDHDETFLDDKSDFLSRAARYYLLDTIACEMHNEGYNLEGNTEASDTAWLARRLYDRQKGFHGAPWENLTDDERWEQMRLAENVMQLIPQLMGRISARCIRISQAINTTIKAEKLAEWHAEQKKRPGRKEV